MSEPVLLALLFADRIITEDNNKKGIIGTFNGFMAHAFPVIFPPWAIYIALTNIQGKHAFQVTLKNIETEQVVLPLNGEFESKSQDEMVELPLNLGGVSFPEPGKHLLAFSIDGELVGTRMLVVDKISPPGNSPN